MIGTGHGYVSGFVANGCLRSGTGVIMNLEDRVSKYVAALPPSVSGQRGHDSLFVAAGVLVSDWALSDEEALPFLFEFNSRCMPPWSTSELKRKLKEARKKQSRYKHPIGHLRGADAGTLPEVKSIEEPYIPPQKPDLTRFRKGYLREFEQMSANRGWAIPALQRGQSAGILRFGRHFGFDCWIALDSSGICGEARRLDDEPFPACRYGEKDFEERKAQAIKHSLKSWPVGLQPVVPPREPYSIIMIEGGPDLLSAYHFAHLQNRTDILPVSMLGNGMAVHGFHAHAWPLLRGRRIRICPHHDADGQGLKRALHWANQLVNLGCTVDFFVFEDVFKPDGKAVKDLTDCIGLSLEDLFP
jgi:hypothetical protein